MLMLLNLTSNLMSSDRQSKIQPHDMSVKGRTTLCQTNVKRRNVEYTPVLVLHVFPV